MTYVPNELLGRLTGCRLLSVQFILDYLQLRFDSDDFPTQPLLTCDELPAVRTPDGRMLTVGEPGWADAMISLPGRYVTATTEAPRAGLQVVLGDLVLVLDPAPGDDLGPEIAMLSGFPDQHAMVWRPGEDAFEHLARD